MPRPRFEKLPAERREALLEAAAKEFAAHGYEGASLNRILDAAGVSKGAAYYYFDDKADLFLTTVAHFMAQITPPEVLGPQSDLTAETFWPWVSMLYRRPFAVIADRPWAFGVVKAAGKLPPEMAENSPVGERARQINAFLGALIAQGQRLGVIRTDVADDLLLAFFKAVDDAGDHWLLRHWDELSPEEMEHTLDRIIDMLHRALAPVRTANGGKQ
jgi:AcrR family transcriptional regulator